jgi:excisionase family DNA binding protein
MTDSTPDYSTWLTKAQAAKRLGVSTKTIENLGVSKIANHIWTRPTGGPPIRVYATEDVERLGRARAEAGAPRYTITGPAPAATGLVVGAAQPAVPPAADSAALMRLESFLETISKKVTTKSSSEKVFLTIPEAAEFAGLSESYIRRGCRDGSLPAIRDGHIWRIRRTTLLAL